MSKNSKFEVVIACGGKGTRLKNISKDFPKPLFPVLGKSTLLRSIEELYLNNFKNILITVAYKSELFSEFVEKIKIKFNLNIEVFLEPFPMGECGALWELKDDLSDDFVFINGDLIYSIDFERLMNFHRRLDSKITLVTHTSDHIKDSDLIAAPNGTFIKKIKCKSSEDNDFKSVYLGNSGIYVIKKNVLDLLKSPKHKSQKSVFHYLIKKLFEKKLNLYSYNTSEYIKDMGTPERLIQVQSDLKLGVVENRNYKNKQKVLFIDRDNTILKCPNGKYILDKGDIEFLEKNILKIANLSEKFNFVCMVTNQPQISMGLLSIDSLDEINSFIVKYCILRGLKIDIISFCPHHPHPGFNNEKNFLKLDCFCRKPNPGMFIEQAYLRNIDLKSSLMIGDSTRDQKAAENAGCKFQFIDAL